MFIMQVQSQSQPQKSATHSNNQPDSPHYHSIDHRTTNQQLFYSQSLIKYPYFFQENERIQWLRAKKQQFMEAKGRKKRRSKDHGFIVVRKVRQFVTDDEQGNCERTWVVNQKTMEIITTCQGDLQFYTLADCLQLLKNQQNIPKSSQTNPNTQNLLFLGSSCSIPNRSINITHKAVSSKHVLLRRIQNPIKNYQLSVIAFILSWKKSGKAKSTSRLCGKLCALGEQLVRKIVGYVGYRPEEGDRYFVEDYRSKNGTWVWLGDRAVLKDNATINVAKKQGISLTVMATLHGSQQSKNLSQSISQKLLMLSESQPSSLQPQNRNKSLQSNPQACLKTIFLLVQTPSSRRLYILYSIQSPYILISLSQYTLSIQKEEEYNTNGNKCRVGVIQCDGDGKWKVHMDEDKGNVKKEGLCSKIISPQQHEIKDQIRIQLGNSVKLIIQTNIHATN